MESPSRPSIPIGLLAAGMLLLLGYYGQARIQRADTLAKKKPLKETSVQRRSSLLSVPEQQPENDSAEPFLAEVNPTTAGPISINKASAKELETVLGIGPVLSSRIVEYRRRLGSFNAISQLTDVKGIGPKTLAKMRKWLKL